MSKDKRLEMLLRIWVRLDEVKNLVSACKKGFDAEMQTDCVEMRSILSIVERELKEVIEEIDYNIV